MSGKARIGWAVVAAVVGWALLCTAEVPHVLAAADGKELVCLECHRQANVHTNEGVVASRTLCLSCHGQAERSLKRAGAQTISLQVAENSFEGSPHRYVACVKCHADVARSPHRTETGAQCLSCHTVHGEGKAHAPHRRVDCQACHFTHEKVALDAAGDRIVVASFDPGQSAGKSSTGRIDHALRDAAADQACRRCHTAENTVGAPAAVLPAKSILCIACHPAPAGIGHPIFGLAALVMLAGVFFMLRFWFIGSVQGEAGSLHRKISLSSEAVWNALFSRQILTVIKTLLLDILLQRRILKESVQRWTMHSLIYIGIVARFSLSLMTGIVFALDPQSALALALTDPNHPFTAFVYDLLGLLILLGIVWAAIQRFAIRPAHVVTEIKDNVTLGLIGLLVVLGFVTTAARLVLTALPAQVAMNSFIAFPISRLLGVLPLDWRLVYPWLWYAHAIVGAALMAYLPYGKLKHIFNVPLTYLLEEVDGIEKPKRV